MNRQSVELTDSSLCRLSVYMYDIYVYVYIHIYLYRYVHKYIPTYIHFSYPLMHLPFSSVLQKPRLIRIVRDEAEVVCEWSCQMVDTVVVGQVPKELLSCMLADLPTHLARRCKTHLNIQDSSFVFCNRTPEA